MTPETGYLVFFFPRKNTPVSWLISIGEGLGRILRHRVVPRRVPHHVEGVVRKNGVLYLYGADAHSGFIGKPARKRLSGLVPQKDYLVVALPVDGLKTEIQEEVKKLDGTPYESWRNVVSVWRDGNRVDGAERIFCSEAWVRILGRCFEWARNLDPDNTDPLELMLSAIEHGKRVMVRNDDWT